jgi:hypothetical protein
MIEDGLNRGGERYREAVVYPVDDGDRLAGPRGIWMLVGLGGHGL